MTTDQVTKVANEYMLVVMGRLLDPDNENDEQLQHLRTMLPQMVTFAEVCARSPEPERSKVWEKLNRWLGFVQGVLYSKGIFTIEQMRDHNRSQGALT